MSVVRFVGCRIIFDFMVDDGSHLAPIVIRGEDGSPGPVTVAVSSRDWDRFCETGLTETTASVQAIVDAQDRPAK